MTSIEGSLYIQYNDALTSLDELSNLASIGALDIWDNDALRSLEGLNSLTSIGRYLHIRHNDVLPSLDGLSSLTSIGSDLEITSNSMLSACSCGIGALLASEGVTGTITIHSNLPGCNSPAEVLATPCETSTGVEAPSDVPEHVVLAANYPNPFNPQTAIRYGLPEPASVRLVVFDAMGRRVHVLVEEYQAAGWHEVVFDGGNLPSGVYFYRLEAGAFKTSRRMLLIR